MTALPLLFIVAPTLFSLITPTVSSPSPLIQPVHQFPIDINPLGRVALTGNFDAVSLYQYQGQNTSAAITSTYNVADNTSSLLTTLPNGQLATIASSDAHILAMCPILHNNGSIKSIVLAGNFTRLNNVQSTGIALFDPNSHEITAIKGLDGQVFALHCDNQNNNRTVYIGGEFSIITKEPTTTATTATTSSSSSSPSASSSHGHVPNVAAWSEDKGISILPFGGFNNPVHSITPNQNGTLLFGGTFTSLVNSTTDKLLPQVINLSSVNLKSENTAYFDGYNDTRNIVCKTSGKSGPGNTWLLQNNKPGYWGVPYMDFDFKPSKLRIWNTRIPDRGTKLFAFRTLPSNGLLNMSYMDDQGKLRPCNPGCPLPENSPKEYHEFTFTYPMRMTGFNIEVWDWYGSGGGFDGIELLSDEINTYAAPDLNEPTCATSVNTTYPARARIQGEWYRIPATKGSSSSAYLKAIMNSDFTGEPPSVTFEPDIKVSANYSIYMYTPGCTVSESCKYRGLVNITYNLSQNFSEDTDDSSKSSSNNNNNSDSYKYTTLYQTNEYEKYDKIYDGYIEAASSTFRPSLTLSGIKGARGMEIVASHARFIVHPNTARDSTTSHRLNGLFAYNPSAARLSNSLDALTQTPIVKAAGAELDAKAQVNAIASVEPGTFVIGGKFSNKGKKEQISDILSVGKSGDDDDKGVKINSLPDGGLNGEILTLLALDQLVYVGGTFNKTAKGGKELLNAAIYDSKEKKWTGLGGKGFNGAVRHIAEFPVIISLKVETAVAFSGEFTKIDTNDGEIIAAGFAVWVPSKKDWLDNVKDAQTSAYYGKLTASLVVNDTVILAGNLKSGGIRSPGAVELYETAETETANAGIGKLPVKIQQLSNPSSSSSTKSKRTSNSKSSDNEDGPLAAEFYNGGGKNLTILGGHFTARDSNNKKIHNLVILDGRDKDKITGLSSGVDQNSTFLSVAVQADTLFAGGKVTGSNSNGPIAGVIAFDLKNNKLSDEQPAALQGNNIVVNAIAPREKSSDVYVGGRFDAAGGLPCPSVCLYQMDQQSWSRPGAGLDGTVNVLKWANSTLIAAGNLTVNDQKTYIATYSMKKQEWVAFNTSNGSIPGPVTSLILGKKSGQEFWFSGVKNDGSGVPYVMHFNESGLTSLKGLSKRTTINDIRIIGLKHSGKAKQGVILLGRIEIPNFGFASAAILRPGSDILHPFLLSTDSNGQPASINGFFSEKSNTFEGSDGKHSRGIVVLVSFCIALGCVFLIVLGGIIASRIRRKQQGYIYAPQMMDRKPDLNRLPPAHLLNDLNGSSAANA
ncbi:hypothetical protein KEM54_004656 [Ascosphaera aggregata]|nr:hypothetical protein KEM54_004656 [Ascosphaera aggregata]